MEKKQTKKKARHAAKSWDFKFRGGVNMINAREIAETLSRKNPVAVVTLLKTDVAKDDVKKGIIVIHHSLMHRSDNVVSSSLGCLIKDLPKEEYDEYNGFAVVTLNGIDDARAILDVFA